MWIPIALFQAFTNSTSNLISKHQVKTTHPIVTLFLNQSFTIICMFILILLLGGIPQVTPKFFLFMFCSSILDFIAFTSGYWAIKHSQISLLSPLNSLTPLFATIFGAIFLHEIPTLLKLLGILTIVCGVYLLNVADIKHGLLKPFQKLLADKGVKLYFIQVILWGITPIFQKQAIFETHPTTPLFASFFGFLLVTIYLSIYAIKKIKPEQKTIKQNLGFFILFGVLYTLSQLSAYTVFSITQVGYATALFSLSSLLSIIMGGLIFKETNIKERLLGATVMIAGVILIVI